MSRLTPSLLVLDKGLDLQTAKILAPEGSVFDSLNYEQVDFQGQKRIDGYARYDGTLLPAFDEYYLLNFTPSSGWTGFPDDVNTNLFVNGKLWAVAIKNANEAGNSAYIQILDYSLEVGIGDSIFVGDTSIGDITSLMKGSESGVSISTHYDNLLELSSTVRTRVTTLPEPIAGLHWFKDRLYAVAGVQAFEAPTMVGDYDDEVLSDSPVAYWKLDDPTGSTTFLDSSQNSITAKTVRTWAGAAQEPVMQAGSLRPGGQSANFSALANIGVEPVDNGFSNLAVSSDGIFSIECIIETPTFLGSSTPYLIRKQVDATTSHYDDYLLGFFEDGTTRQLVFGWTNNGAGSARHVVCPFSLEPGSIYHVVGTSDVIEGVVTVSLYVNGQLAVTRNDSSMQLLPANSGQAFTVNAPQNWSQWSFEGRISDVAIYNSALPPNRILAHAMAAGLA